MRLHDVARYFDNEPLYDGYDPSIYLCDGQLGDFNDSTSVGATLRRRTLSIAPEHILPTRMCVYIEPLVWLAGLPITESFQGRPIRKTYNLRLVTNAFLVSPPGALLDQTVDFIVFAYSEYFKSNVNLKETSDYETFWNVFFAPDEGVQTGMFLVEGVRCLRVRQIYQSPDRLFIAQADELEADWSQSVTFNGLGAYDPLADAPSVDDVTVPAIMMDMNIFYRWTVQAQAEQRPGDKTVIVSMSGVTPVVGADMTMMGRAWKVLAVQPELDAWAVHARPA